MQLVAYGAQDIYLTGNPQITFFKVVYRRHTNFAMECVQQTINGTSQAPSSGTATGTVTISRNGDLVGKVYVEAKGNAASVTSDGNDLISEVEVEIGGQRIDRHYAEWNKVWNELSTPQSKADGLKYMTGGIGSWGYTANDANDGVAECHIPLNFWFCRNPGLALPLIALQYHEVKLKFTWGTMNTAVDCEVWADYIYLDTDERRRFAQVSHEYLIEQVQKQSASADTTNKLNFNHPVKELVWTSASDYTSALLKLNGHDRFSAQEEEYFQLRQPYDCHTAIPGHNILTIDSPNMLSTPLPVGSSTLGALMTYGDGITDIDSGVVVLAGNSGSTPQVGDVVVISVTGVTPVVSTVIEVTDSQNFKVDASVGVAGNFSIHIIARAAGRCRTSQLTTKINVYSFALKPEEHQPSGTCNFSRIDNAQLITGDNLSAADNIYAVNYNVLRIMSGMGGLAYSN